MMGSPDSDTHASPSEKPEHRVELGHGFWLGETEVTQAQWRSVMGTTPWSGKENARDDAELPATYVSWGDATEFCSRLTEQERRTGRLPSEYCYRLPMEAEWEYACRAGTTTPYSFGEASRLNQYAWSFDPGISDVAGTSPHRVGQMRANAWGLRDMHGNVSEWCSDWYDGGYYKELAMRGLSTGQQVTPSGPVPTSFAQEIGELFAAYPGIVVLETDGRVHRGGSWIANPASLRCASRGHSSPDSRTEKIGFRIVRVTTDLPTVEITTGYE
jgi:formylglycine-generating enzyme required for sulfatase activity